jgi:hypothetical protein
MHAEEQEREYGDEDGISTGTKSEEHIPNTRGGESEEEDDWADDAARGVAYLSLSASGNPM